MAQTVLTAIVQNPLWHGGLPLVLKRVFEKLLFRRMRSVSAEQRVP
ncbi:hypothetical protein ATPR_0042 [Acetobacter tropicalis NBRC 101654]|uniref:Oxidoreductase n=1 Tax=Acetobacter tropicalis NBRC 101654 TaxID=749388 RepID=F7V9J3_9PROT|nr:hypothetical protein ATPR_0042 [Acetobacter tropicalis NBRC 101654]